MRTTRNTLLGLAVVVPLALSACADTGGGTSAESPDGSFDFGNMTMIVGFAPGSGTDSGARLMAAELEKRLDTTITVQNQEGAGGQVGLTALSKAACDGNTFGTTNFPSAIVSVLDKERGAAYTRESFAPVGLMVVDPTAVAVLPDDPIKTPQDVVSEAKANPGKLQYTTTGVATQEHFAVIALEKASGTKLTAVHFPDGGGQVKTTFLGGDVRLFVANVSDMTDLVKNNQARVIGVMEEERSPLMPDVPTFAESGADVAMSASRGFSYPSCAPKEAANALSDAVGEVMKDKEFLDKMAAAGLAAQYLDAAAYKTYWSDREQAFTEVFDLAFAK